VVTPLSCNLFRNAACRTPNSKSVNNAAGPWVSSPSRNTSRGMPASLAASHSNSQYDTSGRSRTGDPYRNPATNTNTSAARTASRLT
jgi:hypothetical protein